MKRLAACACAVLASLASFCANAEPATGTLEHLVALAVGNFNNSAQYAAQAGDDISRLYHRRVRINSPHLKGHWVFAQINEGDKEQAYRQTVVEFFTDEDGGLYSRAWRLRANGMKDKGIPSAPFLNRLTAAQLEQALPDSCNTRWRWRGSQFEGVIDHRKCVIQSKYKDEKRQLFAEEILFREGMWAREGAYRMNGEVAFGLPEQHFYQYRRTP